MLDYSQQTFNSRYQVLYELGSGGMGRVYKATDYLDQKSVAIKTVLLPPELLDFMSRSSSENIRLSLAREFQTLASVRHPNIISVYDYGFENDGQPFLVLELLENALELTEAAAQESLESRLDMLRQVAQALAYLHRRRIIHRDLKPGNILVKQRLVKVLDFGLSIQHGHTQETEGTLPYMAPEMFLGQGASEQTDIYALGVIAFEIFAGQLPFIGSSIDEFMKLVIEATPDFDLLDIPENVLSFLSKLLQRNPSDRYQSASAVISSIDALLGTTANNAVAVRESYLQSAQFTGRRTELNQLEEALQLARHGNIGSAWLISGESGVGKSRLIHELRTQALVDGFIVLDGQATNFGGDAYYPWRHILSWLSLINSPDNLEASILKLILPDLPNILNRDIVNPPQIEPEQARTRLYSTITGLIQRIATPALIILEDLHWASAETLNLFDWLSRNLQSYPVVMVATYRSNEQPNFRSHLSNVRSLELSRLEYDDVILLIQSMLGERIADPAIIEFVFRESEGNVLFIVEVIRALAEAAGNLGHIHAEALPNSIITGGIIAIFERILDKVNDEDMPLLRLAAVAGRILDLDLLQAFETAIDVEGWLTRCSNIAVVSVQNAQWQFTHDKLRETLVSRIPITELSDVHHEIALAIEQVFPDSNSHINQLAFHWGQARVIAKELEYTKAAARQATEQFAFAEAIQYLQRALEIAGEEKLQITYQLGKAQESIGHVDIAEEMYRSALLFAPEAIEQEHVHAHCMVSLGHILIAYKGNFEEGFDWLEKGQQYFIRLDNPRGTIDALSALAMAQINQGRYDLALTNLSRQHDLAAEINDQRGLAAALRTMGHIYVQQADHEQALDHYQRSLTIAEENNNLRGQAAIYGSLGAFYSSQGDLANSIKYNLLQLDQYKKLGNIARIGEAIIAIGGSYLLAGSHEDVIICCQQGLTICIQVDDRLAASIGLIYLAECFSHQQQYDLAEQTMKIAVNIVRNMGRKYHLTGYLNTGAAIYFDQGKYFAAITLSEEALEIAISTGNKSFELNARITKIRAQYALDHVNQKSALTEAKALLHEYSQPEHQADIHYLLWKIDHTQMEAKQIALNLYLEFYQKTHQYTFLQHYNELSDDTLEPDIALPAPTDLFEVQFVQMQTIIDKVTTWIEQS